MNKTIFNRYLSECPSILPLWLVRDSSTYSKFVWHLRDPGSSLKSLKANAFAQQKTCMLIFYTLHVLYRLLSSYHACILCQDQVHHKPCTPQEADLPRLVCQ